MRPSTIARCRRCEAGISRLGDCGKATTVAATVARDTPRGWRIDRSHRTACIDGVVALAMAVERAEAQPEPVALLGWV